MTEQTYTQKAWSLKDLFEGFNDPNYEAAFKEIEEGVEKFEAYRDHLSPELNEELFIKIIKEYEQFFRLANRLGGFAAFGQSKKLRWQMNWVWMWLSAITTIPVQNYRQPWQLLIQSRRAIFTLRNSWLAWVWLINWHKHTLKCIQ